MVGRLPWLWHTLSLFAAASAVCPPNTGQFECYTVSGDTETVVSIAASRQFHANPLRVCDYNSHLLVSIGFDCLGSSPLPDGIELRVPGATCIPMAGIQCYEVQGGDTLESLAFGNTSLFRDVGMLERHNVQTLWGQRRLFEGMHLRRPTPPCIPDHSNRSSPLLCHTVLAEETLGSIAQIYQTSADALTKVNAKVLGPHAHATAGMRIRVPHPNPVPDPTKPCKPDPFGLWTCYTVATANSSVPVSTGESIWSISLLNGASPARTCELNGLWDTCKAAQGLACVDAKCSANGACDGCTSSNPQYCPCPVIIQPGQTLLIAKAECEPQPGEWTCAKIPFDPQPYSSNNYAVWDSTEIETNGKIGPRFSLVEKVLTRGPYSRRVPNQIQCNSGPCETYWNAFLNLNKPTLPDKDVILDHSGDGACALHFSNVTNCYWFPGKYAGRVIFGC
jgi:hypothetical protein